MSAISRDEVAHLARLSRLAVTDAELDVFAGQLGSILEHVKVVTAVADLDVAPLTVPAGNENIARADRLAPGLTPVQALAGAPNREGDRFAVPRILGEE